MHLFRTNYYSPHLQNIVIFIKQHEIGKLKFHLDGSRWFQFRSIIDGILREISHTPTSRCSAQIIHLQKLTRRSLPPSFIRFDLEPTHTNNGMRAHRFYHVEERAAITHPRFPNRREHRPSSPFVRTERIRSLCVCAAFLTSFPHRSFNKTHFTWAERNNGTVRRSKFMLCCCIQHPSFSKSPSPSPSTVKQS